MNAQGSSRIERIVVRGVGRTFGTTVALRAIDATFVGGEVAALEGSNGSGKTTLLGIIGTVMAPTSGEVQYQPGGLELTEVRRQIGWVSHDSLSYPDLT